MKKHIIYCVIILLATLFMVVPLPVRAAETGIERNNPFKAGTVWEVFEDTDVKERADKNSETVHVFTAGTMVLLLEDQQGGWSLAQNQSDIGYIPVEALQIFEEENVDTMNQEFAITEQEQIRAVEEQELRMKEKRSSFIWKLLIVFLAVLFFGIGIYDAMKRKE